MPRVACKHPNCCHFVNANSTTDFYEWAGEYDCNTISCELASWVVGSASVRITFFIVAAASIDKVILLYEITT